MNTRIVTNRTPAQQAAQAAVMAYRAGFHQEAAILWRAAIASWFEKQANRPLRESFFDDEQGSLCDF